MSTLSKIEPFFKTPLHSQHVCLNAKMVGFGGWDMPLQYEGILAEYQSTRQSVTVFDTCHMGEFFLSGDCKKIGLDRLVTSRIEDMPVKSCRYGMTLNVQGGVVDDLIVYRIAPNEWMVVVNAGTMLNDQRHFLEHLEKECGFRNVSANTGKLDIQGPQSRAVLMPLVKGIEKLEYYSFDYFDVLGERAIVSRTGYTGELGYEIYFPWEKTSHLWNEIFKNPLVKPAGLGVRDVLRIEMGYSLYGHELDESISPLEAGLKRFVDFEKDFVGRDALMEQQRQGVSRQISYFTSINRRSPRNHNRIFSQSLEEVGVVTSGTFSPGLQKGIGIGFLSATGAKRGGKFWIGDEKNRIEAHLTKRPFYSTSHTK